MGSDPSPMNHPGSPVNHPGSPMNHPGDNRIWTLNTNIPKHLGLCVYGYMHIYHPSLLSIELSQWFWDGPVFVPLLPQTSTPSQHVAASDGRQPSTTVAASERQQHGALRVQRRLGLQDGQAQGGTCRDGRGNTQKTIK